jgi:hypothetical protein
VIFAATGTAEAQMGPDYWKVHGVASDDTLNIRSGPSTQNRVVARAPNGAVFRNLGCRGSGNGRWCHLETPDGRIDGWASGRFLQESGAPTHHTSSGDDSVPELHARNSGEMEVRFASGCTALYNPVGRRISAGSSCSRSQLSHAHDAVESYMREQGGRSASTEGGGGNRDVNLEGQGLFHGGSQASGRIFGHREGAYAVIVSALGGGPTCTGSLMHAPGDVRSEVTSMHCSNGVSGMGTLVRNRNGSGYTLSFTLTDGDSGYVIF